MNAIMQDYYPMFRHYQALRNQMMALLSDEDLAFAVEGNESLGTLCKQMGDTQQAYVQSFADLTVDFGVRHADDTLATSVERLNAWYDQLDADLEIVISGFSDDDLAEKLVDRGGGFELPIHIHLDIYKEALLIFYCKARVYLRAMGKALPEQWQDWIA